MLLNWKDDTWGGGGVKSVPARKNTDTEKLYKITFVSKKTEARSQVTVMTKTKQKGVVGGGGGGRGG